jgi:hypothetical protein
VPASAKQASAAMILSKSPILSKSLRMTLRVNLGVDVDVDVDVDVVLIDLIICDLCMYVNSSCSINCRITDFILQSIFIIVCL